MKLFIFTFLKFRNNKIIVDKSKEKYPITEYVRSVATIIIKDFVLDTNLKLPVIKQYKEIKVAGINAKANIGGSAQKDGTLKSLPNEPIC